ncbi:MAG: acyloxyacyl hydrolase [Thermodesulfobacteriota bacterium]
MDYESGAGWMQGLTYTPVNDIYFGMLTVFAHFDYEEVAWHKAPDNLRFRTEASIGSTQGPFNKFMGSVNMFAMHYCDLLSTSKTNFYFEAGIGLIYQDFRVEGQGLRFNFNPQAGCGIEFLQGEDRTYFTGFRFHHVSNGDLHEDNTGINSAVLLLGRYF